MKIDPATMPGSANGSSTDRVVRQVCPPRSCDASICEGGIRSSAAYTGMIMNGSQR